jgi:hypothetical protein
MQLPNHPNIDVQKLSTVFNNTTTSYKFYWFYSLLKAVEQNKTAIELKDLFIEMVIGVWYPSHYFKINFGQLDQLGKLANEALYIEELGLQIDSNAITLKQDLSTFVSENPRHSFTKNLLKIRHNVPFRFVRPWFETEVKGLRDDKFNQKIKELATANNPFHSPYYFENDKLIFDENWFNYFQIHLKIMKDFCFWNLLKYLQKRNPNVPNIAAKLFPPSSKDRSLTQQHKFWKKVIDAQKQSLLCVYSNQIITENYALDHFIPWSFVTHNQLWNLVPISQSVNSQKSNNLPKLDTYFEPFANLQFDAFHIGLQLNLKKSLEDYLDIFNADLNQIKQLSKDDFKTKLRQQIEPMSQVAANMGFTQNWIYLP